MTEPIKCRQLKSSIEAAWFDPKDQKKMQDFNLTMLRDFGIEGSKERKFEIHQVFNEYDKLVSITIHSPIREES